MKETQIIRLPLQYFAEGDGTGTEPEGGSEGNGDDGEKAPTFDDILKDKSMQAEFDRRVSKAMEKQKATLTEEFGKTLEEKLSEAKKLEKLNAEQKAEYERQMKDKALAEREAAVAKRELTAEAISQLAEKGLPQELSTCLNYDSVEACKSSLEAILRADSMTSALISTPITFTPFIPSASERYEQSASVRYALPQPQSTTVNDSPSRDLTVSPTARRNSLT